MLHRGTGRKLGRTTYVKRLTSSTSYFIHCDFIDKDQNLFNGKKSDVLARFMSEVSLMKKSAIYCHHIRFYVDCAAGVFVNSFTLSVKD